MNNIDAGKARIDRLWTKDYILLMISNFFLFFGNMLLIPVLPVYIKQSGASDFQIGIVVSVFFVTAILMRIFTSGASARLGQRTLLMLSVTVFSLTMLGYYLWASLMVIIMIRMVQGAGLGISSTLYATITANVIPNERMGEGIGYFGLCLTIATALGPVLGAVAVSLPDFKWVFLVAFLLQMIAVILTAFIKIDDDRKPAGKKAGIKDFFSDIVEPKAFYEAVFMLLIGLVLAGYGTYVILFAKEIDIKNISVYFFVIALAEFLVRIFSGRLYDRKGMNIVVVPGAIAGIISCIVMAKATNLAMVSIAGFLCGAAMGIIFPVMEASAMKNAEPERRIAANATLYNFFDIGMGLGPLLFGVAAQLAGYSDAFMLSSLIFVAMLAILASKAKVKRRKKIVYTN